MSRWPLATAVAERTLLATSAAVVVAVHLLGVAAPPWLIQAVPLGSDLQQLLPAAQIAILAAWLVLGPGPLWLRLPATPVLLIVWAVGWTKLAPQVIEWAGDLLPMTGLAAVTCALGLRLAGLRMTVEYRSTPAPERHPQFSIQAIIVLTTFIAIGLGVLEWLRPRLQTSPDLTRYYEQMLIAQLQGDPANEFLARITTRHVVLAAATAITALAAMWCIVRPGAIWLRLLVVTTLLPLLGMYLADLTDAGWEMGPYLAMHLSALGGLVAVSLVPLRLAGLRLVRRTNKRIPLFTEIQDGLQPSTSLRTNDEPRTSAA